MLALGLLLFIDLLRQGNYFLTGLNLWPLIVIGLGAELLISWLSIRRKKFQERIRLDGRSLALLFLVGVFSVNYYLTTTRVAQGEEPTPQKPLLTVTSKDLALPTQIVPILPITKEVVIENPLGTIEVTGTTARELSIDAVAHVSIIDKNEPVVSAVQLMPYTEVGESTTVKVKASDEESGSGTIDLKLIVPTGVVLKLRTEQGDIIVRDYYGDADLTSKGGAVTVETLRGDLRADLQNGPLSVHNVYGNAELLTGVGNIQAKKISGNLNLASDGGDSEIGQVAGNVKLNIKVGKVSVDTVGGDLMAMADSAVLDVRSPLAKVEATIRGLGDMRVRGDVLAPWTLSVNNGKTTLEMPKSSSIKFLGESNRGVIKGPTKSSKNAGTKQGTLLTDKLGDGTWPVTVRSYHGSIFVDLY